MGLLFSKYASPYFFTDELIRCGRFSEFVTKTFEAEEERKLWELYLSCVANPYSEVGSFDDFRNSIVKPQVKAVDLEATVKTSFDMINSFNPEAGGETI